MLPKSNHSASALTVMLSQSAYSAPPPNVHPVFVLSADPASCPSCRRYRSAHGHICKSDTTRADDQEMIERDADLGRRTGRYPIHLVVGGKGE